MKAECIRCTAPTSQLKLNLLNCITIGWGAIGDEEWKERGGVALRVLISESKATSVEVGSIVIKERVFDNTRPQCEYIVASAFYRSHNMFCSELLAD